MKPQYFKHLSKAFFAILFTAILTACSSYLDNPLKDKETGEDINLLILDFNFFNTRLSLKLQDASDGSLITSPAVVSFSGKNGDDIVTFTGDKKPEFTTALGQLEVTVDPNVTISESSPFEFAVNIEAEGYNGVSKAFLFNTEGKKTLEINLSKDQNEEESELGGNIDTDGGDTIIIFKAAETVLTKSALTEEVPFKVNYQITWNDLLKFKDSNGNLIFNSSAEAMAAYNADPSNFISISVNKFSNYPPETDVVNINGTSVNVLFQKLETGKLTRLMVNNKEVADFNGGFVRSVCSYIGTPVPDLFGFAVFSENRWNISGTENSYSNPGFSYTVVKASTEPLCTTGSRITFNSEVISSFSIDADVYDSEENLLTTLTFKGNFPETFAVENTPQRAVKLVFRNNNPAFQPLQPLVIENFCTGNYNVNVAPTSGYVEYQIVLKAFCNDNPSFAVAPTYSGEFKIKNSDNAWQGVDMAGGVVNLLGLPSQEYQLRLLWENEWEYSSLFTEFDANGNYLRPSGSAIDSEKLPDGRVRINIDHFFSQKVCDDMNW